MDYLGKQPLPAEEYIHGIGSRVMFLLKHLKGRGLYLGDDRRIVLAACLSDFHDIGKSCIPTEILKKPAKLTDSEYTLMQTHTLRGNEIMEMAAQALAEEKDAACLAAEICLLHHERIDGSGYPFGLKGDRLSIEIQTISLADAFDALCSERCYKKAVRPRKAAELICKGACGRFSPELCAALQEMAEKLENREEITHLKIQAKAAASHRPGL